MGLYENIKQVAKTKGYSINRLEQELGFARSYIGKFKTITPSAEKFSKLQIFSVYPLIIFWQVHLKLKE